MRVLLRRAIRVLREETAVDGPQGLHHPVFVDLRRSGRDESELKRFVLGLDRGDGIWTHPDTIEEAVREVRDMVEHEKLKARVKEQAERVWDTRSIEAWFKRLEKEGIPGKVIAPKEVAAGKRRILKGIQERAEECTYLSHV